MLITGGYELPNKSAEIYHPDRDSCCDLPDLPDERYVHTQDGSLMCGGASGQDIDRQRLRSCRKWNPDTGAWDLVTESLTEERVGHTSWTLDTF